MNYQRLYDHLAPFYAPAMRLIPGWLRYAQQALSWLPADGAILEIGPGPGVLLAQVARRYPVTVGLDLSLRMLQRALRRPRRGGLAARLVQGTAVHLPFAEDRFDGICLTFTFSAIPDGCAAMREMHRVLRPAGRLVLIDAGVPGDGNVMGRGLARLWTQFGDLETGTFNQCLDSGQHAATVDHDLQDAITHRFRGTPSFLLNDQPLAGPPSFEYLRRLIDSILSTGG